METKLDLNPGTIEVVQDLIQANLDSANGFKEVAKEINDPQVAGMCTAIGAQRDNHAGELQYYVVVNGERARTEGTWLASLHRIWLDLRAKLNGGDPYALLGEVQRGEEHIKSAYEETLTQTAGSALNDVLLKQYENVKIELDQIGSLRQQYESD